MNELATCFPASYRESRERLLERAHALAGRMPVHVDTRELVERGPGHETLALDFVILGARRPRHALVLSSGTHGVEGYTGGAIQFAVLERLLPHIELADDSAIVIQHANNPYGFAWHRRVNENNVDINRNFRDRFDDRLCDPDYERLYEVLNPTALDDDAEFRARARIDAWIAQHGLRRFQQVAVGGQYRFPEGLQFGGATHEASTRHLLALIGDHLQQAQRVAWLDFHTGLGGFGDCELVTGAAADSACYLASQRLWAGRVRSASSGESVSTPLNGLLDRAIEAALPAGCEFAFAFPEYGTYEPLRVIHALRADNWLHRFGNLDDARSRAIRAESLEAFCPASPEWRHRVVATGLELVEQALAALPEPSVTTRSSGRQRVCQANVAADDEESTA